MEQWDLTTAIPEAALTGDERLPVSKAGLPASVPLALLLAYLTGQLQPITDDAVAAKVAAEAAQAAAEGLIVVPTAGEALYFLRANATGAGYELLSPGAALTALAALPKAGGVTMTGQFKLSGDGTDPLHPVTKQQLDALSIAGPFESALYHALDLRTQGTAGGTFTAGADQVRTINTERTDQIGVTLAGNQFTPPAGTYLFLGSAPAYNCGNHQAWLWNATDGAELLRGTSEMTVNTIQTQTRSWISGLFTLAAPKALEIRHRCATTVSSNGFGAAGGFGPEHYTEFFMWKVG
ncbi:hypothetical protein SAMN06265365_15121 [Tistlia consotensis]|uniref:Uncharacterized protein n=1 Tax=Tistlia consotensis USBA 355 TaxID=560819 RepID=A0A1Y6CQR4_9PROT|nr:hypothetical protein [Tistlia consotensis]SMF77491.1 hypothetical protein SAMN05428998_1378 [Tistlia consotensis USBA 355]SMF83818.1 hypothetical protein SAMN05428998_15121 [Tistlia consotensis USBA 355]SNS34558.1 hypothetical protein SAMN06265365_15121 [Tistlia consotensis]